MAPPDFSEFTYGFALTYELVNLSSLPLAFTPVFPSLLREGSAGGGYDVQIPAGSSTGLFLEFKACQKISRRRANIREVQNGMATPFLRLPLRKERSYAQHDQLLKLDNAGAYVAYVGPAFAETVVLNDHFFNRRTAANSLWVRPSEIPSSFDRRRPHWLSFEPVPPFDWDFYSIEREQHGEGADFRSFIEKLGRLTVAQPNGPTLIVNYYERLRDLLREMVQETALGIFHWEDSVYHVVDREPNVLRQIAFLAQTVFDCSFLVASPTNNAR